MSSLVLLCTCVLVVSVVACTPKSKQNSADTAVPKSEIALTVVRHVQQDSLHTATDTLLHGTRVDVNSRPVDLYFCRDTLHLPIILPSGGFSRSKAQEKECNWEIYPATVRCCSYDSLDHVIGMSVHSAESTQEWKYTYDDQYRVVECKGWWSRCRTEYDDSGRIARLTAHHDGVQEEYNFAYAR